MHEIFNDKIINRSKSVLIKLNSMPFCVLKRDKLINKEKYFMLEKIKFSPKYNLFSLIIHIR